MPEPAKPAEPAITVAELFVGPPDVVTYESTECAADAYSISDLKDLLGDVLGVTFHASVNSTGTDGTIPLIELRNTGQRAKDFFKDFLKWIPGFKAGPVGYAPPPALADKVKHRNGGRYVWTQSQLREIAAEHCSDLHQRVGTKWDGRSPALARAAADAVVAWCVFMHGLRCTSNGNGCWIPPETKLAEGGLFGTNRYSLHQLRQYVAG